MWADSVSSRFFDSYANLITYENSKLKRGEYIHYARATASWHELGRNQIVKDMQGDWLLMLDTDHVFAPDLLERLARLKKKHKAQVISAIYQYKAPPHGPVANIWTAQEKLLPILEWDRSAEILQVGAVGAGCLLIDREVFLRIGRELGQNPFDILPGLSEDYSFCLRCKKLGIPILLATQVQCHHMIPSVLDVRDYRTQPDEKLYSATVENGMVK
jgi:GT2 family glycosyltransferase